MLKALKAMFEGLLSYLFTLQAYISVILFFFNLSNSTFIMCTKQENFSISLKAELIRINLVSNDVLTYEYI